MERKELIDVVVVQLHVLHDQNITTFRHMRTLYRGGDILHRGGGGGGGERYSPVNNAWGTIFTGE